MRELTSIFDVWKSSQRASTRWGGGIRLTFAYGIGLVNRSHARMQRWVIGSGKAAGEGSYERTTRFGDGPDRSWVARQEAPQDSGEEEDGDSPLTAETATSAAVLEADFDVLVGVLQDA